GRGGVRRRTDAGSRLDSRERARLPVAGPDGARREAGVTAAAAPARILGRMSLKIDQDHSRFRAIVRGKIRQNLRKYISQGELIGRKGKDLVSIPIPQIDIPHFSFGDKQKGGSGQGDGEPGDPMGGEEEQDGDGGRQAGQNAGEHALEVDVTLDELAAILGEELELPDIQDKGKSKIINAKDRYTSIRRVGPESLRNFKRTYREALKRQIATGTYSPSNPIVVPIPNDKRYRSWKTEAEPVAN